MNRKIGVCFFFFYVLFVVYNTLLPFKFDRGWQDMGAQIHQIRWHPSFSNPGSVSLTDIAGNIILFVPFGFLLYQLLYHTGRIPPILWSVVASAALSFSIEFAQLFISVRTTSPHDFVNNTIGGLIGALSAAVYFSKISSITRKIFYELLERKPFLLIVVISGLLQFVAAMMPFTVTITISSLKRNMKAANLVPFAYQSVGKLFFNSPNSRDALPLDSMVVVECLIFWTAIGYLLTLCYRMYWQNQAYGKLLLVSLPILYFPMVEFMQLFIISRITDINDVICGYLGCGLGCVMYYLLRPIRVKMYHTEIDLLKIPLLIYGVFILFSGLQPFDWHLSSETVSRNLSPGMLIPFYVYFRHTSLWNISDLIDSIIFFVPISLYWTYRLREKGYNWARIYFVTTFSAFLLGALIEAFQLFSRIRVADITDALAYSLGGATGTFLIYSYESRHSPQR